MGTSCKALLFFSSYYDAIQDLKPMQRLEAYDAIFRYGFFGIEPNPSKAFSPLWKLIKPNGDKPGGAGLSEPAGQLRASRLCSHRGFKEAANKGVGTGSAAHHRKPPG